MSYTVRMVIETIDEETGKRVVPSNVLEDSSEGLNQDQALKYHYALKRAYAHAIMAVTDKQSKDAGDDLTAVAALR